MLGILLRSEVFLGQLGHRHQTRQSHYRAQKKKNAMLHDKVAQILSADVENVVRLG